VKSRQTSFATGGRGGGSCMASLFFNSMTGIKPIAVPFSAKGLALPQVMSVELRCLLRSTPTLGSLIGGGKLQDAKGDQEGARLEPAEGPGQR
jgi:tripartite-type tricarboxylate transporter receptor subunit TctC